MNVFHKVTLQSLKKNRTRTVVTIIGIILSAAMICAVTTFVSSIQNYLVQYAAYNDGNWHGVAQDTTAEGYAAMREEKEVSFVTYSHILGYAKVDSQNEFKPYIYLLGGEKDGFFNTLPVHLIAGNYPQNATEIVIPEHLRTNGGVTLQVGDTVTLSLGDRMLNGSKLNQYNPCYDWDRDLREEVFNGETLAVREERTYTVVGIYERPSFESHSAPGYTALTVADPQDSGLPYDVYFRLHTPKDVYDYMHERGFSGDVNNDLLLFSGISYISGFSTMLVSLSAIVIGLIMFGSIVLIYNAFAISVSERTRQFGLLSSVGATKKQLKKMVLFEALVVSAIGIPLGIGVGIAGIAITLFIIGNRFAALFTSYTIPMRICVSWEAVVIAIVVALVTVLLSAWIPSKRATRISAVEAIRQSTDIKTERKPAKTSRFAYKLFGLPGVLAGKHYKRNRKKYRTTVVSLFMSIVLFVSASAFTGYLMESVTEGFAPNDFQIRYAAYPKSLGDRTPDDLLTLLTDESHVTHGAYEQRIHFDGYLPTAQVTSAYTALVRPQDDHILIEGHVHFVNDAAFDALLASYYLDRTPYYDPENPVALALDYNVVFDGGRGRYVALDTLRGDTATITGESLRYNYNGYTYAGETQSPNGDVMVLYENPENPNDLIEIPEQDAYEVYTFSVAKTITDAPFFLDTRWEAYVHVLYPLSMAERVLPASMLEGRQYDYYLQSTDHAASYETLKTMFLENNLEMGYLTDTAKDEETTNNIILIIQVFSYGFIVLISLIAAANVFNTISTNIHLRRREFAMLKSVGMTQKGFRRMMNFECLLYGFKALLYGLPASAGVTYLIYKAFSDGYATTFRLPWSAIAVSVFSVFAVVFATMLYAMGKIRKDNPIDALKNENL